MFDFIILLTVFACFGAVLLLINWCDRQIQ